MSDIENKTPNPAKSENYPDAVDGDIYLNPFFGDMWIVDNGCFVKINDGYAIELDEPAGFIKIGHVDGIINRREPRENCLNTVEHTTAALPNMPKFNVSLYQHGMATVSANNEDEAIRAAMRLPPSDIYWGDEYNDAEATPVGSNDGDKDSTE